MRDINRVTLTGRLTREPELRATAGGSDVLSFGLAVNDQRKSAETGQWEDVPNFVDCTVFGRRAASLHPLLAKGMQVCVDGQLRYSSWEAQDGSRRSRLEVLVRELVLPLAPRQGAPQAAAAPSPSYPQRPSPAAIAGAEYAGAIPFGGQVVPAYYEAEDIPF